MQCIWKTHERTCCWFSMKAKQICQLRKHDASCESHVPTDSPIKTRSRPEVQCPPSRTCSAQARRATSSARLPPALSWKAEAHPHGSSALQVPRLFCKSKRTSGGKERLLRRRLAACCGSGEPGSALRGPRRRDFSSPRSSSTRPRAARERDVWEVSSAHSNRIELCFVLTPELGLD